MTRVSLLTRILILVVSVFCDYELSAEEPFDPLGGRPPTSPQEGDFVY
jgi:hypothetical protein